MIIGYKNIILLATLLLVITSTVGAQEQEHKMELGGMLGSSFYMGDANTKTLYKDCHWAGGAIARYHFNPHIAMKANLLMGRISGNTADFDTKYPNGLQTSFSRNIFDLGTQFECNFWGYGQEGGYKGNRRFGN